MFVFPTSIISARGTRHRLGSLIAARGWSKVLMVVDPGIVGGDFVQDIIASLLKSSIETDIFDAFESNPRVDSANEAGRMAADFSASAILAVGGGSALDLGKAAAILATNAGTILDYIGDSKFAHDPLPLYAIPTTCGSGSEASRVAVLSDPVAKSKVTIKGDGLFPDYAIMDADALSTLPPNLIAWTGMDALTHAVEALIARPATPQSDELAIQASRIIRDHLVTATKDDGQAQEKLMAASTMAGQAFTLSDVGAVHCLSESLGGFIDCPHGLTNAILLAPVLQYYGEVVAPKLALLGKDTLGGTSIDPAVAARSVIRAIENLIRTLEIPPFSTLKVPSTKFEAIAEMAVANGSNSSNQKTMEVQDYLAILNQLS